MEKVEIDLCISEYKVLRSEIIHYDQRIDRISGIYISGTFFVVGYLIKSNKNFDIHHVLSQLTTSEEFVILLLIIPILNSILLLRMANFFAAILAISHYIFYEIRPALSRHLNSEVFNWDNEPQTSIKETWLFLRGASQVSFVLSTNFISMISLLSYFVAPFKYISFFLFILSYLSFLFSIYSLILVQNEGKIFHKNKFSLITTYTING